ncbi:MAG: DUF4058 family protein [Planctomycetes bacterium]|nr:DUF4058 family protein [Planctomycetota bacterium]
MDSTRSPFPGMDPYLEDPSRWRDVHSRLVTYLCDDLQGGIPDRYYARMEDRVFIDTEAYGFAPDVRVVDRGRGNGGRGAAASPGDTALMVDVRAEEIEEHFIEIHDAESGNKIVTVIEILAPTNKREGGEGAAAYRAKQAELLKSDVNMVEIDLLRGGRHTVAVPEPALRKHRPFHYLAVIRRGSRARRREVYPIRLPARLPRLPIPLVPPDPDVVVDLQALVDRAYERGAYRRTVDYTSPPDPPFATDEAAWVRSLLRPSRRK